MPVGRAVRADHGDARAEIVEGKQAPLAWRARKFALRQTLPYPARISRAMSALRAYEQSPLRAAVKRSSLLKRFAGSLARAESSLPAAPSRGFTPHEQPAALTKTVAILIGCVMPQMYGRTHDATVRVLNRLGYRVIFPEAQTCCGALNLHAGDRSFARDLARRNIDAFGDAGVDAVVVNSAGCGSTMKEYHELLADDPAYADRARRFVEMTRDVLEFVAEQNFGLLGPLPITVTYQDSCHLVHAQKVTTSQRALLRAIPRLELREMSSPDRCCGSAGLYSFVQRDMSARLLDSKMNDVTATGATTIATANPGCMMQLEAGLRQRDVDGRVVHVIELLDASMRAAETLRLRPRLSAS